MKYPNLRAEMARRGISVPQIAEAAGKSIPAASNNLNGRGSFNVDEAVRIRDAFFPGMSIDYLFSEEVDCGTA